VLTGYRWRPEAEGESSISSIRKWAALAGAVATLVGAWQFRDRFGDRIVDKLFRRPCGRVARWFYRDATPHQDAFHETLAAIALGGEDHLLEVGSGGGTFLAWALATGCTAKAVDHSTEMLGLASRRNASAIATGRLELHESDAAALPFSDGEFTAAVTINAFFFFDDPRAVLAEMYRTLAPTGRIAIHTLATAPRPISDRMRLYTDEDLMGMLGDTGYEQIALRRTGPRAGAQLVTACKPAAISER
jgi:SAM-dependent methyltransferase